MTFTQATEKLQAAGYEKMEMLGLAPYQWKGLEPESFAVFVRSTAKRPDGQYVLYSITERGVDFESSYEEPTEAQAAFCRLIFPYDIF